MSRARILLCWALGLGVVCRGAVGETVFGSADEKGNMTFSDRVPADAVEVERIELAPALKPETEAEANRRRAQTLIDAAEAGQRRRDAAKAERGSAIDEAERHLRTAEAGLREAREIREGDRQAIAGGGTRLTPAYHERVRAAEERLEQAQQALDAARRAP